MGLFDKKYCDVCGEKIGLLGNRKLEDGNLCKDCAEKLSPWFTGRRHSTVADIKEQLKKREENKAEAAAFTVSRKLGRDARALYIDEEKGLFAICYENDWKKGNPDILPLGCITRCVPEEREHKTELKYKNAEGKMVSYVPPRYEYSYDFFIDVDVEHPYIDGMRLQLNSMAVKKRSTFTSMEADPDLRPYLQLREEVIAALTAPEKAEAPEQEAPAMTFFPVSRKVIPSVSGGQPVSLSGSMQFTVADRAVFTANVAEATARLNGLMDELIDLLTARGVTAEQVLANAALPAACIAELKPRLETAYGIRFSFLTAVPKGAPLSAAPAEWTCPGCGAVNKGKFCEFCGTARP